MAFNGSGTFLINSTGNPVVTSTIISSTWANALTADLGTGLSTCITKDGQTTPTANIPMHGFKITGLGAPTSSGDALSASTSLGAAGSVLQVNGAGDALVYRMGPIPAAIIFGL